MSTCESNPPAVACPPTVEDLRHQAHERLDEIIAYCSNDRSPRLSSSSRGPCWDLCGRWDAC